MDEAIEIPFGVKTRSDRGTIYTYGRHLANTTEQSVLGGDADCLLYIYCNNLLQIIISTREKKYVKRSS